MMKRRFSGLSTFLSRWRWRLFAAGVGVAVVALAVGCVWPIATGRTDPPFMEKLHMQSALGNTRRSGASSWAPAEMRQAEAAVKAALAAYRMQEVQFLPLRDFRGVRLAIESSETRIELALAAGNQNRIQAKPEADQALSAAAYETSRSSTVADAMHLGPYDRTLLQRSKIALDEARAMYNRGDYVESAARAREASAGSRKVSGSA